MSDQTDYLTTIEQTLAEDKTGAVRDAVCRRLREEADRLAAVLNRGLPPAEYARTLGQKDAILMAASVVEKVWQRRQTA